LPRARPTCFLATPAGHAAGRRPRFSTPHRSTHLRHANLPAHLRPRRFRTDLSSAPRPTSTAGLPIGAVVVTVIQGIRRGAACWGVPPFGLLRQATSGRQCSAIPRQQMRNRTIRFRISCADADRPLISKALLPATGLAASGWTSASAALQRGRPDWSGPRARNPAPGSRRHHETSPAKRALRARTAAPTTCEFRALARTHGGWLGRHQRAPRG